MIRNRHLTIGIDDHGYFCFTLELFSWMLEVAISRDDRRFCAGRVEVAR